MKEKYNVLDEYCIIILHTYINKPRLYLICELSGMVCRDNFRYLRTFRYMESMQTHVLYNFKCTQNNFPTFDVLLRVREESSGVASYVYI